MSEINIDNNELHDIDVIIQALENIKSKYGNLSVGYIFSVEDYPIEVISILPCVVTSPLDKSKHIVIFD